MRSTEEIMADPLATQEEVRTLARVDGRLALQHPQCPSDLWWISASQSPVEAMESPLFQLLLLEDPARWLALEMKSGCGWAQNNFWRLKFREQELLAADCVEHVLPIYEAMFPDDDRVRHAILARRQFARREISSDEWSRVWHTAMEAAREARQIDVYSKAADVARAASENGLMVLREALLAVKYGHEGEESLWQWRRFLSYLRGDR